MPIVALERGLGRRCCSFNTSRERSTTGARRSPIRSRLIAKSSCSRMQASAGPRARCPRRLRASVAALIKDPVPGAPVPPILPPQDGFLGLDKSKIAESFAADLPREQAEFMADSQVPWGVDALSGAITEPAWRTKPSWYLVAADDRMIPPVAQRAMSQRARATVTEVGGSHAIYVSNPEAVATLIRDAAKGVQSKKH